MRGTPSDRALILGIAATQVIGWGAMFVPFPLLLAPMEGELGWSRSLINGAYALGLLAGGVAAIPFGRWVDRRGARGLMSWGALASAALLLAWSRVTEPWHLYAVWLGLGLAQAACLWGPAMAVVVATARDAGRSITAITFLTGMTATLFLPFADTLISALGWRGALAALAALQVVPGLITLGLLPRHAPRPAAAAERPPLPLRQAIRGRAFLALALCFAAHAFVATGLGAHLIPLLHERGLSEATVLLIAALHGPTQVAARAVLYVAGSRAGTRAVGVFATALLPIAMLALATAGGSIAVTLLFLLCMAVADGLLTIIRATGVMEILGRANYGAITGAMSAIAVLPRTVAPVTLALIWEGAGGYDPVPWLLLGVAAVGAAAFAVAARGPHPGPPP
ncbi:MAG TPA: MFS transporter [Acetobacteraceae bacterium]|nr:MFS transporter [Acetobacteraceae bacterium]